MTSVPVMSEGVAASPAAAQSGMQVSTSAADSINDANRFKLDFNFICFSFLYYFRMKMSQDAPRIFHAV